MAVKFKPLLTTPPTVTTTLPVVAPAGTGATIEVVLQLVGVAAVPLNVTVLVPWLEPKFVPVIVTDVPTAPELGDRLLMLGVASTVNDTPTLATPPTVTTTLPVVAPAGTGATIDVALQLVGVAAVPLNVTVLVPWVEPKFVPVMVTDVPTAPELGDKLLMLTVGRTVKLTPLLGFPLTVTTTFPLVAPVGTGATIEVALQLAGVAVVPLNFTVLLPPAFPKLVPVIVTDRPTAPEVGDKLVILGIAAFRFRGARRTRNGRMGVITVRARWRLKRSSSVGLLGLALMQAPELSDDYVSIVLRERGLGTGLSC